MINNNYRVIYLRTKLGQPVGCIAIRYQLGNAATNYKKIDYQVSTLNPQDRFNRSLARQLALGRLMEQPYSVTMFLGQSDRCLSIHEVFRLIMGEVSDNMELPARARRAAKRWLQNRPAQKDKSVETEKISLNQEYQPEDFCVAF